jgi:peroxiredoxin
MKKTLLVLAAITAFASFAFAQGSPTPPPMTLKVGDVAPDFTLPDTAGNKVKLSDFRGKNNVVLAFFVLAFTGG